LTFRDIAHAAVLEYGDSLPKGYDERYAHSDVVAELKRTQEQSAIDTESIRQLELDRLDGMLLGIYGSAKKGNHGAIDRVLRIMDRRSKYLGLDAPTKQDVTSGGEPIKAYIGISPDDWDDDK
jgi:hypothetical protein